MAYHTTTNPNFPSLVNPEFIPFIEKFHRLDNYGENYFVLCDFSPNSDTIRRESNWNVVTKLFQDVEGFELVNSLNSATKHYQLWLYPEQLELSTRDGILQQVEEIYCALQTYPVLSEENYQALQYEKISELWVTSIELRIELCKEYDFNIFASRHEDMPEKLYNKIAERYI